VPVIGPSFQPADKRLSQSQHVGAGLLGTPQGDVIRICSHIHPRRGFGEVGAEQKVEKGGQDAPLGDPCLGVYGVGFGGVNFHPGLPSRDEAVDPAQQGRRDLEIMEFEDEGVVPDRVKGPLDVKRHREDLFLTLPETGEDMVGKTVEGVTS